MEPGHRCRAGRANRLGQHPGRGRRSSSCAISSTRRRRSTPRRPFSCAWLCAISCEPFPAALELCESLAADSASFPALARAAYHLDGLLDLRRGAPPARSTRSTSLAQRLFARAVLHLSERRSTVATTRVRGRAAGGLAPRAGPPRKLDRRRRGGILGCRRAGSHAADLPSSAAGLLPRPAGAERRQRQPASSRRGCAIWLSLRAEAADNARLVAGLLPCTGARSFAIGTLIGAVTEFLSGLAIERLIPLLPASAPHASAISARPSARTSPRR